MKWLRKLFNLDCVDYTQPYDSSGDVLNDKLLEDHRNYKAKPNPNNDSRYFSTGRMVLDPFTNYHYGTDPPYNIGSVGLTNGTIGWNTSNIGINNSKL